MIIRIQIDPAQFAEIMAKRGAVRQLLIKGPRAPITGNCILVRYVGQIAPGALPTAPFLIGEYEYNSPIGWKRAEIFQISSLKIGEYFRHGGDWFECAHNETITATDWAPAITEFVGIYGDVRRSNRGETG
ncbi:hypothetical protein UFOVP1188_13 [uncultured Caudovirales phage]|uniref:Uncharacterized protein n=1 Tax=uncultured Caudovirales phage TaxID=2100421 RepID=A0A6J5R3P4_9CAUD|nr:hypothetical protein UFOVP1029_13 [uncultured Caudovirales phage]CAB4185075.1 hypothetical protein UFOVP1129_13 [uncultured Caudovirales phage]CAB4189336.1 hypothetical protein UFOVP1188_13 [uncultured Caudovirales phage]CAB4217492.1 hypothetical protein UFOVP1490_34 [uncultured Caudovirales phage]CAB4220367.1 hypothetical protein UFOVP1633_13 [uncultured Caudovirales phage]